MIIMGVRDGRREEDSGYREGSNGRLAETGHNFPLRDLQIKVPGRGSRILVTSPISPDRVT